LLVQHASINIEKSINIKSETRAKACMVMVLTANSSSYPTHVSERMSELMLERGTTL